MEDETVAEPVKLPEFPVEGGCQCGAVRYRLAAPPVVFYICHCTECQAQSSSAFGESLRVRSGDLTVTGEVKSFRRGSASGSTLVCDFCPECGTRLFHRRESYHETLNVKGGTLDDTSWLVPAGHLWTASRQKWFTIAPGALAYERQPEDYDALMERWKNMTGA